MTSLTIIAPVGQVDTGNLIGNALGLGPQNFTVPLVSVEPESENPQITHYGLLHQAAESDFIQTIVDAKNGILPPINWEDHGLTVEQVTSFMAAIAYSVYPDATVEDQPEFYSAAAHFEHVIQELGLMTR